MMSLSVHDCIVSSGSNSENSTSVDPSSIVPTTNLTKLPKPITGPRKDRLLSNPVDVALIGEPTIHTQNYRSAFLPGIGDLLPAKQQAPSNLYGVRDQISNQL
jgi:hypothetical protein